LISPSNNDPNQPVYLTLDWSEVTNATENDYQFSTDNLFTIYSGGTISGTDATIFESDIDTEYVRRVQATNGIQYSEWSEI